MTVTGQRSSRWDITQLLASNLGANVLGFVSGVVMARFLGAEGRGAYQSAAMFWAIVPGVLTLSAGTALVLHSKRPSAMWFATVAIAFSLLGSSTAWAAYALGILSLPVALILACTSLGYMSSDLCQGVLRQKKMYGPLSNYRWIDVGGGALLVIAFALAGVLTVETAVLALCLSTIAAVTLAWYRGFREPSAGLAGKFSWKFLPSIHGGTLLRIGTGWADQIAIGMFLGLGPLGVYAIATSLATQFTILPSAMNTMLLRAAAESKDQGFRLLQVFCQVCIWSGLAASLLFALVAPPVVRAIFGNDFAASATVAAILIVGTILSGLILLFETYLIAQHEVNYTVMARASTLPGLAVGIFAFAINPNLFLGALIPVVANVVPLWVLIRKVRQASPGSLWTILRFPDFGRALKLARSTKRRK